MNPAPRKPVPALIFNFFASVGLATTLLVILMLLTWCATLEQTLYGLHPTLMRYFHYRAWYVFPDAGIINPSLQGKLLPPLPGGFWVCALLALNLTLGGIIRMRKGIRTIGVLVAHFGIIFMIVAGGVAQLREERGVTMLKEGQTADYAEGLTEYAIEIAEIKDGKVLGQVHLIPDPYFIRLNKPGVSRVVRLPALPFDLELAGYIQNAIPMAAASMAPTRNEPIIDGWYLFSQKPNKESERDTPAIHAKVLGRDGSKGDPFLLPVASYQPFTVTAEGRTFTVQLNRRIWPLPFQVRLVDARSQIHPNTSRPKSFESDIVRIEDGRESKVFIEMNTPMRYGGYTFFQRTMTGGMTSSAETTVSGFEVVKNPSDAWPKYSIIVAGAGLVFHFLLKLVQFLTGKRNLSPKA